MGRWKYALIKVDEDESEDICELVELYSIDEQWDSFCKAKVLSLKELENAYNDVRTDGVNLWFWDNGKFSWDYIDQWWKWEEINDANFKTKNIQS